MARITSRAVSEHDRAALARQQELPQVAAVMAAFPDLIAGDLTRLEMGIQ